MCKRSFSLRQEENCKLLEVFFTAEVGKHIELSSDRHMMMKIIISCVVQLSPNTAQLDNPFPIEMDWFFFRQVDGLWTFRFASQASHFLVWLSYWYNGKPKLYHHPKKITVYLLAHSKYHKRYIHVHHRVKWTNFLSPSVETTSFKINTVCISLGSGFSALSAGPTSVAVWIWTSNFYLSLCFHENGINTALIRLSFGILSWMGAFKIFKYQKSLIQHLYGMITRERNCH